MSWVPTSVAAQRSPPTSDRGRFQGKSFNSTSDHGRNDQNKIYIQNIPMDMQQESFEALFNECGQVVSSKLLDPKGGRNTVAGFVSFSTEEAVEEAIQKMSGFVLGDGPPLRVMRPSNKAGNNNQSRGKTCHNCGEEGHFSRECPNNAGNRGTNQQFGNRFHNGPTEQKSPFSNNSSDITPKPGINNNHSSQTNFMAMLGRGETRNNANPPRPGTYSTPPTSNNSQAMHNGYQDTPINHAYQHQPSGPGSRQSQQSYQRQPSGPINEQSPQDFQQQSFHGNNQQQQPGTGSYQEPQPYQQQSGQGYPGYQQPPSTGGYQEEAYQQQPGTGSYQEPERYQQQPSQGYYQEPTPNHGYQSSGSENFQEQRPSQFQQQNYQENIPYQQPQGSPGHQDNSYYQEPQSNEQQPGYYNQSGQQYCQIQQDYNQAQPNYHQTQPNYHQTPPDYNQTPQPQDNQQSSVQSTFPASNSGQGYQPTSTQPGNSWADSLASQQMNGGSTSQEQPSWQQRSSNDNNRRLGGGRACHKCGEPGHFARECPNKTGSQSCHKCGEAGHFSRECPNKSGPGDGQLCHRCGGPGHFARDCTEQQSTRGGSRDYPDSTTRGGSGCHRCGEEGHFARECPNMAADPSRPAAVTYIPEEIDDMESLFRDAPHIGINFERYNEIPVRLSGVDKPEPVTTFEEANFGSQCIANVCRAGYSKPTPVQKYTFPIVMLGRDLMACAQTGSGKTVAFLLPTITNMIKRGLPSPSRSPLVLCLAPTRELVKQIHQEARKFTDGTPIKVREVYGGVSVAYQSQCLEQGCHFLVATPGRLLDFISREKIYLDNIQCLILDEADRMLDMGFEQDVRRIVEQSNMTNKFQRQTLMFSATFPDEIQRLASDFLKEDYLFLAVGQVGGTNLDIEQKVMQVNGNDKRDRLFDILNSSGLERTLVFVELKRVADFLACLLSENNFPTTSISSDRSQREREEALRDFRNGRANVLVATSVAARGLDIPDVKHVVNYDLPQEIGEYVHRIGRTGRIGNRGKATSFFEQGRDEKVARSLVKVLSEAFQEVPSWLEQAAEDAVGSGYGPKGGRYSSRDHREGGRGRQNGYQSSGPILHNDPNSQFGSQAPSYNMQNGSTQASHSYNSDGGGSGGSYNSVTGTGDPTGSSYSVSGGGTGPSHNAGGAQSGLSYNTGGPANGQVYNIGGGEAGNSDDDWD